MSPWSKERRINDSWIPISTFAGTFDGNYHTLTMTISINEGNIGFVGINNGTIKNLYIKGRISSNSNSTNWRYVGMFAGVNNNTIDNCETIRYYDDEPSYANNSGSTTIYNCDIHVGTDTSTASVGGIAGVNGDNGSVTNCYNNSAIFSRGDIGGIAGTSSGYIFNSDNSGTIMYLYWHDNRSIGGVVGYQSNGTIDYCYNYATISYIHPYCYNGDIKPNMGTIVGRKCGEVTRYNSGGSVNTGSLFKKNWEVLNWDSFNQYEYAGNRAFGKVG